jgi:hypothetical protein
MTKALPLFPGGHKQQTTPTNMWPFCPSLLIVN